VIHLVGPVVLAAALTGIGVYGLIARRNAALRGPTAAPASRQRSPTSAAEFTDSISS